MGIPYAFLKSLNREEAFLNVPGNNPKDKMSWLMQDGNMRGEYLGACLDSCRWGSMSTVMWDTNIRGLMGFIQNWREQNSDDESLYHERSIQEIWEKFELPHIHHQTCPRDKNHTGTITDLSGVVRCAHIERKKLRPSFIKTYEEGYDRFSRMDRLEIFEESPLNPGIHASEHETDIYHKQRELWESEEQSEVVTNPCYAMISDMKLILPFETVLRRMNLMPEYKTVYCASIEFPSVPINCRRLEELSEADRKIASMHCPGHVEETNKVIFPFDGWEMAHYLLKWKKQSGNPPWFSNKIEESILDPNDYAYDD
jgi:hypothetical protein